MSDVTNVMFVSDSQGVEEVVDAGERELREAMETLIKHDSDLEQYIPLQMQEKYGLKQSS